MESTRGNYWETIRIPEQSTKKFSREILMSFGGDTNWCLPNRSFFDPQNHLQKPSELEITISDLLVISADQNSFEPISGSRDLSIK